jgi:hemoglobin-like flavoprotein
MDRPQMTPAAIARVQNSYRQIAHHHALAPIFYARLFHGHPATRKLFPEDMVQQHAHFNVALAVIVWNFEHLGALDEPLRELGLRHAGYGVRKEDYAEFRDILLLVLADCAGELWSPQLREDWWEALTRVIALILDGVPEARAGSHDALTSPRQTSSVQRSGPTD